MKFIQTFAAVFMAQNAMSVELGTEASTCSFDCGERNDFVNTNFLNINYEDGSLVLTDDQKANLADRVC